MKRFTWMVATALALGAGTAALAQQHTEHHAKPGEAVSEGSKDALAEGEIKKVDKGAGKVTIKHGPLQSLDMPAMTMVFRARDPAMLDNVKVGDAIRFRAEKVDGVFTVTEYMPAK